jgi:hypothetical protein
MSSFSLYETQSNNWDFNAGVRRSQEKFDLSQDLIKGKPLKQSWHLPGYSAVLKHSSLSFLTEDQKEYIRGTQLLDFVSKQAIFEIDCVNYVARLLANGGYPFVLSPRLQLDALKVYTDEGYHSYYTKKVADQIREYYDVDEKVVSDCTNFFFEKIEKIKLSEGSKNKDLAMLALVIVAECQIVNDISREMEQLVYEPIRMLFRDHMKDEAFHASFFKAVMHEIWPQLTIPERALMGRIFCASMFLLGTPRTQIYHHSLAKFGVASETIAECIADIYDTYDWKTTKIRERMAPTLALLKKLDMFEIPELKKLFVHHHLL